MHLDATRLVDLASGGAFLPGEEAHLAACAACRRERRALAALLGDLRAAPRPPKALRRATLERLGLAPKPAGRSGLWAGSLAGGMAAVLAWLLLTPAGVPVRPLGLPSSESLPPASAPVVASAKPDRVPAQRTTGGVPARPSVPLQATVLGAVERSAEAAPAPAGPSAAGEGAAPAAEPVTVSAAGLAPPKGDDTTSKPAQGPTIDAVRGNLVHPAKGERVAFDLEVPANGPVVVTVYDASGRAVSELFNGAFGPGSLPLGWDGDAPSGAYTILARAPGGAARLHVLVVR